jgi:hypothetical protein
MNKRFIQRWISDIEEQLRWHARIEDMVKGEEAFEESVKDLRIRLKIVKEMLNEC